MASVVEVYLFQLVDFDNDTGAYTVRDQADLTEEQKEVGIALGMVVMGDARRATRAVLRTPFGFAHSLVRMVKGT